MLLNDAFKQLSRSRLQVLAVGGLGSGTISAEHRPLIIDHLNEGLRKLFSIFPLKDSELIIKLHEHINLYYLRQEYRMMNMDSSIDRKYRYIEETPTQQFTNDVIRILSVANKEGIIQYQNDPPIATGLRLAEFDCIQVPLPRNGEYLFVKYTASHDLIPHDADPFKTQIHIPSTFEDMLFDYVGYLEFSSMTGERQQGKAQDYLARYNNAVNQQFTLNLVNIGDTGTNTSFRSRGFV